MDVIINRDLNIDQNNRDDHFGHIRAVLILIYKSQVLNWQ